MRLHMADQFLPTPFLSNKYPSYITPSVSPRPPRQIHPSLNVNYRVQGWLSGSFSDDAEQS